MTYSVARGACAVHDARCSSAPRNQSSGKRQYGSNVFAGIILIIEFEESRRSSRPSVVLELDNLGPGTTSLPTWMGSNTAKIHSQIPREPNSFIILSSLRRFGSRDQIKLDVLSYATRSRWSKPTGRSVSEPQWVWSQTQATHPSGRIDAVRGAVTAPTTVSPYRRTYLASIS